MRDTPLAADRPNFRAVARRCNRVAKRAQTLSRELQRYITPGFEVFVAKVQDGGADENEWTYVRKDGSRFPVMLSATAIRDLNGVITGYLGIASDISHRKQHEQQIRVALAEKEMLLKEVYHRVKNNLQVVISLLNLQFNALPDSSERNALRESADRVRAMALVHEKLYESSNLASLPTAEYVTGLCRQIESSYPARQGTISITCDIDPLELGMDTAIPLGLLLNELISNCIKHAFPDSRTGHIAVSLKRINTSLVELKVIDNGIGLPPDFDAKRTKSLGVKLSHRSRHFEDRSFVYLST